MTASTIPIKLDASSLTRAFETLSMRLRANTSDPLEIVVCGGSALILTGAVPRTTLDVDVVALESPDGLLSPHDVSEGFRSILENLLRSIDHGDAAEKL